jgi:alpha-L-fucosidase
MAEYYNAVPDGVIDDRFGVKHSDFKSPEYQVLDKISPTKWEECRGLGRSFGYNRAEGEAETIAPDELIYLLVDIVSKNGNLLVNIGPRSDGTIPDEVQSVLREVGSWLKINGEAIYGTRPWKMYGEGPTKIVEGAFHDTDAQPFTERDFRFTTKDGALYGIELGWPSNGEAVTHSLSETQLGEQKITSVSLLGSPAPLTFAAQPDGLHIRVPAQPPGKFAYCFKITFQPAHP